MVKGVHALEMDSVRTIYRENGLRASDQPAQP